MDCPAPKTFRKEEKKIPRKGHRKDRCLNEERVFECDENLSFISQ